MLPGKYNTFKAVEFPLYGVDNKEKWDEMIRKLQTTDYVIIASNRLYVPLMKLTDCNNLPKDRCYPITARYYDKLFDNKFGYLKVAEFSSYPQLPISHIGPIGLISNDDGADESFTVYDHPKIMIFKNIERLSPYQLQQQLLNP